MWKIVQSSCVSMLDVYSISFNCCVCLSLSNFYFIWLDQFFQMENTVYRPSGRSLVASVEGNIGSGKSTFLLYYADDWDFQFVRVNWKADKLPWPNRSHQFRCTHSAFFHYQASTVIPGIFYICILYNTFTTLALVVL